jgi:hypothetical protein
MNEMFSMTQRPIRTPMSTIPNLKRLLEGLSPDDIERVKHYENLLSGIFGRQFYPSSRSDKSWQLRRVVVDMLGEDIAADYNDDRE